MAVVVRRMLKDLGAIGAGGVAMKPSLDSYGPCVGRESSRVGGNVELAADVR